VGVKAENLHEGQVLEYKGMEGKSHVVGEVVVVTRAGSIIEVKMVRWHTPPLDLARKAIMEQGFVASARNLFHPKRKKKS